MNQLKFLFAFALLLFFSACSLKKVQKTSAIEQKVFEEKNGIVAVEAEHFYQQELDSIRKWYTINTTYNNSIQPDQDEAHHETASGGAYLEILPDTRVTHDDKLIVGENFSNEAGKIALLHYKVFFNTPGKYYVWVRTHSTGTEDNGIHVGLDGKWVKSGQRMQWCEGNNEWTWASKQRTKKEHCGVEKMIYLNIENTGIHTISFSMREDGFEFDKWVMSTTYASPEGFGPKERLK